MSLINYVLSFQPVTVLTNLQRGNIQTQTTTLEPDQVTIYIRAAMGEIGPDDFRGLWFIWCELKPVYSLKDKLR